MGTPVYDPRLHVEYIYIHLFLSTREVEMHIGRRPKDFLSSEIRRLRSRGHAKAMSGLLSEKKNGEEGEGQNNEETAY